MLLLGLAGLVAVHVFMLAGHGSGNSSMAGIGGDGGHAASVPSSRSAPGPDDEHRTAVDLTVACLAVLAGLILLGPRRAAQAAIARPDRPAAIGDPAPVGRAGPRTRSLTELCVSLT
jgi:hypothetical protein